MMPEGCKLAEGAGITSKKAFDCKSKGIDIVKFGWPGLRTNGRPPIAS